MLLVVEPQELQAWRMRIGATQAQFAERAKMQRTRVAALERKMVGVVTSYKKINQALASLEAERKPLQSQAA